ncbi:fungal-specific transcription factor domain-containing protein [Ilyonectria robusta]|uniref:fungal-specific transcription factor domain-containing protein n=1 Tax=Ilyonectria robusta TaxID=1079257 RepID=UPI001E8CB0B0|nr:fungal-specific transcription factor domain-containing protein [Ilyonectria robusta]KAH8667677.1 fungal-specific transcription factor domain-containing protein [Ilyonectria robusta]
MADDMVSEISDGDEAGSAATRRSTRRVRRYGFACTTCKSRKVKCSGDQPLCRGCGRSGEECVWPSQNSTESRLRNANARIRDLEASIRSSSQDQQAPDTSRRPESVVPVTVAQPASDLSPVAANDTASPSTSRSLLNPASSLWFQAGIGDDGTITYNGPTSRFHAGSLKEGGGADGHEPNSPHIDTLRSQYALMDSVWTPLITTQPFIRGTGVATETVYRPAMIMDLALGGPYCSNFLLMCIFGLVARHLPKQHPNFQGVGRGDQYIAQAKMLLLEEMAAPRLSITTIQGLLILGGRQGAMGNSSEGWLYTGMALRMMTDIGLHLDTTKLAKLERWTPAEIETRKRLYNSAYIWDKTLSLALGRPPSLTRPPFFTQDILDKFDDDRPWRPVHALEVLETFSPSPSLNSSAFCAFCRIHEITTDMMLLFSRIPSHEHFTTQVGDLDARFQQWYDELPNGLKISEPAAMPQSPPPHIVSLNLLYHTLRILLRRPYLISPDMYAIHGLYTRTFPHRPMTYQVSYCIFIAATIEVQELRTASTQFRRDEAATRLGAAVRVLQDEASHTPGIGRSLDTIRRLLCVWQNLAVNVSENAEGYSIQRAVDRQQQAGAPAGNRESDVQQPNQGGQEFRESDPSNIPPSSPQFSHMGNVTGMGDYYPLFTPANGLGGCDDVGFTWTDTGAGFHPEAMSWAATDNSQRPPGLPTFSDQGWVLSDHFGRVAGGRRE